MYQQVWRFANYENAILVAKLCVAGSLLFLAMKYIFAPKLSLPRSVFFLHMLLSLVSITFTRFSWRLYASHFAKKKDGEGRQRHRCVIYGAGSAGEILARYARGNPKFGYSIVGFIDDNQKKLGQKLHGFKILGSGDDLKQICGRLEISTVIIAIRSIGGKTARKITNLCQQANVRSLIMPEMEDSLGEEVIRLRSINERDLLRRVPKPTSNEAIERYLHDRTVMVTGGGGSIGSEICTQVARSKLKRLVIVDSNEYNLYLIDQKLEKLCGNRLEIISILGSVTNRGLVEKVFKKYRPSVVLHAAAYKHVPIVEENAVEGIRNNVKGTYEIARAAAMFGVEKVVLISTDKAVRSLNIMGHSKRCCELLIQSMQLSQAGNCCFSAVRFGNVLGSSGSVIPLFLEQIKSGGPVTVTDKDVTRFFMLAEEAVGLVLQTVVDSKGGEIFVLDMGDPVKIYDMARQLIHLNGKEPFYDIDIDIIGLRTGEKLHEELIIDGAEKTTLHSNIYVATPVQMSPKKIQDQVRQLLRFTEDQDEEASIRQLMEITEEDYKLPSDSHSHQTTAEDTVKDAF